MRRSCPAPWYCATKVLTYDAMPCGKQTMAKWTIPAGKTAAIDSSEYFSRNIRSMKFITVHAAVEKINGSDIRSTSRPPQGRAHQLVGSRPSAAAMVVSILGACTIFEAPLLGKTIAARFNDNARSRKSYCYGNRDRPQHRR